LLIAPPQERAGKINAAAQGLEVLRRRVSHLLRALESPSQGAQRRSTDSESSCVEHKRTALAERDAVVKSI